jgi:hypothetical protein
MISGPLAQRSSRVYIYVKESRLSIEYGDDLFLIRQLLLDWLTGLRGAAIATRVANNAALI